MTILPEEVVKESLNPRGISRPAETIWAAACSDSLTLMLLGKKEAEQDLWGHPDEFVAQASRRTLERTEW